MKYPVTTQTQIRLYFWENHLQFKRVPGKKHNDYPVDIRLAFCDFVDMMRRGEEISEKLAKRATL